MIRFYILPLDIIVHSTDPYSASRTPKYISSLNEIAPVIPGVAWISTHFGLENMCMIKADVTTIKHEELKSFPDVISLPQNLNATITSGAIATITPLLENKKIPVDWLSTSLTYKQTLRRLYRIFRINRLLHERFNRNLFEAGYSLTTQFNEFPLKVRNEIIDIATELNADTSGMSGTTTVRQIIKKLMDAQNGSVGMGEL